MGRASIAIQSTREATEARLILLVRLAVMVNGQQQVQHRRVRVQASMEVLRVLLAWVLLAQEEVEVADGMGVGVAMVLVVAVVRAIAMRHCALPPRTLSRPVTGMEVSRSRTRT